MLGYRFPISVKDGECSVTSNGLSLSLEKVDEDEL